MQINGEQNANQQNAGWHEAKLGRFSCSQFHRLMTEPKLKADKDGGNLSDGAMTYVMECVAESVTGQRAKEEFTSKFTDWGNNHEPIAKGIYNAVKSVVIQDSGYIPFDYNAGGSPDGLIGDDGLIEIKCPYTITSHLDHRLNKLSDIGKKEYYWQCIGYLAITGRKWIDFVSYSPNYPGKLQMTIQRINAVDVQSDIDRLITKLKKAYTVYTEILNKLK